MTKRGSFIVEDNAIPHCPHSQTGHHDYIHKNWAEGKGSGQDNFVNKINI